MFHKLIYKIGAWLRNPSLVKIYKELKDSEKYSLDQLQALQKKRLKMLLEFAGENSPFYSEIWENLGWKGKTKFGIEDFERIPIMTKDILISKNDKIHSNFKFDKLFNCETSGTSGQVLTFKRDEYWDSFNRAAMLRGYSWHNVNPWEFNLYFWGYNIEQRKRLKIRLMDRLVNRYRIFDYSDQAMSLLLKKLNKAHYIEGYSSMIYELTKMISNEKVSHSSLKMIKGTSEKIYPHYKELIKNVFNIPITSEYGAAESGIIAFSCAHGNMHINMEGVYLEIENDGSVLVTNLFSYSFPIIRYRLGDIIELAPNSFECPCGLKHPVINDVTGRIGKKVKGIKKDYPSLIFYYVFKNLYFNYNIKMNYQIRQYTAGQLEVHIREDLNDDEKSKLINEINMNFGDDMKFECFYSSNLRMENGKLRDFISHIE